MKKLLFSAMALTVIFGGALWLAGEKPTIIYQGKPIRSWIEDVAAIKHAKYAKSADLPAEGRREYDRSAAPMRLSHASGLVGSLRFRSHVRMDDQPGWHARRSARRWCGRSSPHGHVLRKPPGARLTDALRRVGYDHDLAGRAHLAILSARPSPIRTYTHK